MKTNLHRAFTGLVCGTFSLCLHAQTFDEISAQAGIDQLPLASGFMGGGVVIADFNGDNWDDLYITGCNRADKLYLNNGDLTFTDVSDVAGITLTENYNTIGAVSGDIDNDGDQDLFVYTWKFVDNGEYAPNLLFVNNGNAVFTEVAAASGLTAAVFSMSATMLDVNLDGFLDLYVGNYVETSGFILEDGEVVGFDHTCFDDILYINNQNGTFTDVTGAYGIANDGCTLAVAATDYDSDGDTDLMLANDFGEFIVPNKLYRNEYPLAVFTDVGPETNADQARYSMGLAIGDYDEDLDLDYYITNMGYNPLLRQDDNLFEEVAADYGIQNDETDGLLHTSWGTAFFDADNDSYLDLFVANGHMPTIDMLSNEPFDPNKLYRQNGLGNFEDVSALAGLADTNISRGMALGDFDRDGLADLAVVNIQNDVFQGTEEHFLLYHNISASQNWIAFELSGTQASVDAIGAQIYVYAGGRVFLRELSGGGDTHCSQHSKNILVGLGEISEVDSVQIRWPGNHYQSLVQPMINQYHTVTEPLIIGLIEQSNAYISIRYDVVAGSLWVDLPNESTSEAVIYLTEMSGKIILERYLPRGCERPFEVPLPTVPTGIYVVKVRTDNGLYTETLCVYNR
jgi:hypothetical protein